MESIVTTALVGTAQNRQPEIATGTPVDALTAQLREDSLERALLLSAGARAIYRQAGHIASVVPTVPAPAAPESLPVCSPRAASLLARLLAGEFSELLPEALQRMQQAGVCLTHELLPAALDVKGADARAAVAPVIGARGRWLSQFNPAWSWVADYLPISDDPGDAGIIWQEGEQGQREALLRRLRATDPAKAREWLIAAWKQEKAETRALFLKTFDIHLSSDDETFLERALDDRSSDVRASAASLLASLPASALSKRMQARADAMLFYERGTINVRPCTELLKNWQRDGISSKLYAGMDERASWFRQVVSLVSPTHWQERFGILAHDLIAAAWNNQEWRETLIAAWAKAATRYSSVAWIEPLWECCYGHRGTHIEGIHITLLGQMPPAAAEQRIMRIIAEEDRVPQNIWIPIISALPRPWSVDFCRHFLQQLSRYIETFRIDKHYSLYYDRWYVSLPIAMQSLSPDCFAAALRLPDVPDASDMRDYNVRFSQENFQKHLRTFKEGIRLRQQLIEEIG